MPFRPVKLCAHSGCNAFAVTGSRCKRHSDDLAKRQAVYDDERRKNDPALALAARIRSGTTWQRLRLIFRAMNPVCCDPLNRHQGYPEPTEHVHHVIALVADPSLAYDTANLRPLCTNCHTQIEAMERSGKPTQHLFANGPS